MDVRSRSSFQRGSFWSFSSLLRLMSSSHFVFFSPFLSHSICKASLVSFPRGLRLCYHSPVSCKWMHGSLWLFKKATRYLSCRHEGCLLHTVVIVKGVEALHLHVFIYNHVSVYLTGTYLLIYLPTYLHANPATYLSSHPPASLPTYLHGYLPTYLSTCQPSYQPTYPSTFTPTCQPVCLLANLTTYLPAYPSLCQPCL